MARGVGREPPPGGVRFLIVEEPASAQGLTARSEPTQENGGRTFQGQQRLIRSSGGALAFSGAFSSEVEPELTRKESASRHREWRKPWDTNAFADIAVADRVSSFDPIQSRQGSQRM